MIAGLVIKYYKKHINPNNLYVLPILICTILCNLSVQDLLVILMMQNYTNENILKLQNHIHFIKIFLTKLSPIIAHTHIYMAFSVQD